MIALKLQRIGRRGQPSYRFVVANKRSKLGGPPIEDLGSYNPFSKKSTIKSERVDFWLKQGAQPTITVFNLLVKAGVVQGKPISPKIKKPVLKKAPSTDSTGSPQASSAQVDSADSVPAEATSAEVVAE